MKAEPAKLRIRDDGCLRVYLAGSAIVRFPIAKTNKSNGTEHRRKFPLPSLGLKPSDLVPIINPPKFADNSSVAHFLYFEEEG